MNTKENLGPDLNDPVVVALLTGVEDRKSLKTPRSNINRNSLVKCLVKSILVEVNESLTKVTKKFCLGYKENPDHTDEFLVLLETSGVPPSQYFALVSIRPEAIFFLGSKEEYCIRSNLRVTIKAKIIEELYLQVFNGLEV